MKQRASISPDANLEPRGAGVGLLWILVSVVLVALVFLPVLM